MKIKNRQIHKLKNKNKLLLKRIAKHHKDGTFTRKFIEAIWGISIT